MRAAEIQKILESWDKKARRADSAYQETGIQRYSNERRKADDMVEICQMALNNEAGTTAIRYFRVIKGAVERIDDMQNDNMKQKAIRDLLLEIRLMNL